MNLSRQSLAALRMLAVLTVLLGVVYPAAVWGIGRVAFADQASGSLVRRDGTVVGSSLLGQAFTGADTFHGRPSLSDDAGGTSGGSNLAASDPAQRRAVAQRRATLERAGDVPPSGVAAPDALTASASGLDPDISPAYALAQVPRVARATGIGESALRTLVRRHTTGRTLGFLGEPRVDVLELNLALALDRARG